MSDPTSERIGRGVALRLIEERYGPDAVSLLLASERMAARDQQPDQRTIVQGEVLGEDDGDG